MNRFSFDLTPKKHSHTNLRRSFISAAVILCAVLFLRRIAASIAETAVKSQAESLKQAILRSAIHCYSVEGAYPESLSYLKEHYGIDWNPEKYVVDYEITGANLMPTVTILPWKGSDAE